MEGIYEFAGHKVEIHSIYDRVHSYCREYKTEGEPEFVVEICEQDLVMERERSRKSAIAEGRAELDSSDDYLEELAVYRKIAEKMPDYDTFLFHGSCIAVDGHAYLFTAKSGTGKSTHARFWREYLGDRAVMVKDDKPLIHVGDGQVTVFGTPYNGKHRLGNRIAVPLRAICLLERAQENWIKPTTAGEAFPRLLQQAYRPFGADMLVKTVNLLEKMTGQVALYKLGVNMSLDAAKVAFQCVSGEDGL